MLDCLQCGLLRQLALHVFLRHCLCTIVLGKVILIA